MQKDVVEKQDQIILRALEDVCFDGWTWEGIENAAEQVGYEKSMAAAVFPAKLKDALMHFSDWADREMLKKLHDIDPESMRIRDRIRLGVQTRLNILLPHKEAVKHSLGYWIRPLRKFTAGKIVWRTADQIWRWAGDTSTDYNHYTKRTLLSGVMTSTMLVWLNDQSEDQSQTLQFLDRRIENVMQLGKVIHSVKNFSQRERS